MDSLTLTHNIGHAFDRDFTLSRIYVEVLEFFVLCSKTGRSYWQKNKK